MLTSLYLIFLRYEIPGVWVIILKFTFSKDIIYVVVRLKSFPYVFLREALLRLMWMMVCLKSLASSKDGMSHLLWLS